jgi:hypothetical protein
MIAAFLGLFVFGTLTFFIALAFAFILLLYFLEHERGFGATLVAILAVTLVCFGNGINVFSFIAQNPLLTLGLVAGYFAAGTLWATAKWYFYVRRFVDIFNEVKANLLKREGPDAMANRSNRDILLNQVNNRFIRSSSYSSRLGWEDLPLAPSNNKATILMWMGHWIPSMIWTLINDPVRKTFRYIYNRLSGTLVKISTRASASIADDIVLGQGRLDSSKHQH